VEPESLLLHSQEHIWKVYILQWTNLSIVIFYHVWFMFLCSRPMTVQWELWCGPIMTCGWLQEIMLAMSNIGRVIWIMWRCSRHIRRRSEVSGTGTAHCYKHNATVHPLFISSFISHVIAPHHSQKPHSSHLLLAMLRWLIDCCLFWE